MPLKPGKQNEEANFHDLRHGPQFARTEEKHGAETAHRQMIAIALKEARKRANGGRAAAERVLPPDHKLGMRVPKGGSCCANCHFLATSKTCGNPRFVQWNGSPRLPDPSDEYCCDLYEHNSKPHRARGGKVHVGPIRAPHPGRTDTQEMKVPDGAYVLPSETISHLGQNNSEAGLRVAEHLFGPNGTLAEHKSAGGKTSAAGKPVDCVTAGGEYVIGPDVVRAIGGGDIDRGHKILDHFVMGQRKAHIRALASLAPPAKD